MERRNFFRAFAAGAAGLLTAAASRAQTAAVPAAAGIPAVAGAAVKRQRVAYHLADLDKVAFVLANIANHVKGTGGPGQQDLVLVVHGPALAAFRTDVADKDFSGKVESVKKDGVELDACVNTMASMKLELRHLLPGFVKAEQGGVVRLAELQEQGYAYLRP